MKKIRNLLFMVLLVGMFTFIIPNKVDAIGEPAFSSITIKQGNTVLTMEGDYYVANGYEGLKFTYELVNTNTYGMGEYIAVYDVSDDEYPRDSGWYHPGYESSVYVDFSSEYAEYLVVLCEDWNCENTYDTRNIKVRFTKYSEIVDDEIYYTKVMQGGVEKTIDSERGAFSLNNLQDVTFSVTGDNLDSTANYTLTCANNEMVYTGAEIMAGVDYDCVISSYENDSIYLNYKLVSNGDSVGYKEEDYIIYPTIYLDDYDTSVKSFGATIGYVNYGSVSLPKEYDGYWDQVGHYLVLNRYFNDEDPIEFNIVGNDFENRNYDVALSVYSGNEKIYTKNYTVSGNSLNSGYNAVFSDFDPGIVSGVRYIFKVTIDGVSKQETVEYIYSSMQLIVNSVSQGYDGEELEIEDGVYIAPGYEDIYVDISVTGNDSNKELYVKLANGTSSYGKGNMNDIGLYNFSAETMEFPITLCGDMSCDEVITFDTIKIKLTHYNQIQNQTLYFYNVVQGDTVIEMDSHGTFTVNDKQVVTMRVKGENVISDATYTLSLNGYGDGIQVLGSELASQDGVLVSADPQSGGGYIYPSFRLGSATLKKQYFDGENYIDEGCDVNYNCINFDFDIVDSYNKTYTATLKYKNYPDVEIAMDEGMLGETYLINTQYHGTNKPLMYYIKGSGYNNDTNYSGEVKIIVNDDELFYQLPFTIKGSDINNGKNIDLTGLVMPLVTDIDEMMNNPYGMPLYSLIISIDSVNQENNAQYNSVGSYLSVTPEIFFQNGKKNLASFRGFAGSGMYDTNKDVFEKYSKIYINFLGYNFENSSDVIYSYIIDYGYYTENIDNELVFTDRVESGTITGKRLNEYGVFVELDNHEHYKHPAYRFYVMTEDGSEILAYTAPVIYTLDVATLSSAVLTSQERDMYLNTGNYSYIATRNMPIQMNISGIGFTEDRDYEFEYCYAPIYTEEYVPDNICDTVKLNGKELNDGEAMLYFEEEIDPEAKGYAFYIYGEGEGYMGQGGFNVEFVENKEFLPTLGRFIIDDASDIIRNIKKQTTVYDFIDTIAPAEGNTVKVFDKTGENEVTGYTKIGTGMQSRVIDEYNRNVINIGIAVQGDLTGDGNISVTDLVKENNHLLRTSQLEDVYEAAGDVDGVEGISITDLVNMCKDVTGIEELD